MASAIVVYASLFLVICLIGTSIAQNQNNNVQQGQQGGGLLDNKLKPLNNQQYNDFDWRLSKALNAKEESNFVVSPVSVKLALSMLYLGTQGPAAKEIEEAFNINSTQKETVEQKFSSIMRSLETKEQAYELNIGTKLFADAATQVNPDFARKIKEYYNSSVHPTDFKNKLATKADINAWCSKITKGKIPELVSDGDFNDDTVIMLLNAIFFRGEWKYQFPENETRLGMFRVSHSRTIHVQMMSLTEKFNYYDMKDLKAHLIRLPYVGEKFAMYILYPYEVEGLASLANDIKPEILSKSLAQSSEKLITLRLPKFKFESTAHLVEILKGLHIRELFGERANLEGIGVSPKGPLMISNILQKSGIEVSEKGTIAFASTNVVIDSRFGSDAQEINITHPFIFLIADEAQKNIVFIGKVIEPLHLGPIYPQPQPQPQIPLSPTDTSNRIRPGQEVPTDFSEKLNYFDKELLIKIYQTKQKENIALSPASIKVMLAMLLEGAAGYTEKELKEALRLPEEKDKALAILQKQFNLLKNTNGAVTVDTKNKVFLAADEKLSKRYIDTLTRIYASEFQKVNFIQQDEALQTINSWVQNVTQGLITSLVSKDDLDPETRLLLANCIFFKGDWRTAFDPKSTYTHYFHNGEPERKVKYMTAEIPIKYHEDRNLDAKIAEIPFKDERYAFTIVLPNRRDGISALMKDLNHNQLLSKFGETKETTVKVTLPKTTIQFKTPLADILSLPDIDIKDVFSSKSNLTGMLEGGKPILVKDIYHNAKIEITEEGAKAAGASGSHIVLLSATITPEFRADHPFLFFIRDTYDSGFLFEGVLVSPDPSNEPVSLLTVDNRNTFNTGNNNNNINNNNNGGATYAAPTPPRGPTTPRRPTQNQRPTAPPQQSPNARPSSPQGVNNRINGQNQAQQGQGQGQASPQNNNKPIIGYQAPRPQEKGSIQVQKVDVYEIHSRTGNSYQYQSSVRYHYE
ncbi:uncharacterized protein LOC135831674 isoform X2 [Planococcus citri]|uniref:uncharacterized protein LOC135831674 isoform X2 n=1 Tax=Planococcus citri TaxID=170843 RepID=UPI0031F942AD